MLNDDGWLVVRENRHTPVLQPRKSLWARLFGPRPVRPTLAGDARPEQYGPEFPWQEALKRATASVPGVKKAMLGLVAGAFVLGPVDVSAANVSEPKTGMGIPGGDCELLLEKHGFLSRAKASCKLQWNGDLLSRQVSACLQIVGTDKAAELAGRGMTKWDGEERRWGKVDWCSHFPGGFSQYLRK